jgi:3-phosphoshikimate 1-carboxyvinyltransferase
MNLFLDYTDKKIKNLEIKISGSKSESNRLLILQQWFPNLILENLSDSDDTIHLTGALNSKSDIIDIGHAGTAMRFLTAYFSIIDGMEVTLTGSERMQNRPIKILVEALRSLDAKIDYLEKEGYPPLRITGKTITKKRVKIKGNVSSQYISALVLIAPHLKNGLELELLEEVTSRPYLEMTLNLLNQLGITTSWKDKIIKVDPKKNIEDRNIVIESDWSSASYFYSLVALSNIGSAVKLTSYKKQSLQGDSCLFDIYKNFGVETSFKNNSIKISKTNEVIRGGQYSFDLKNAPDLAQTIIVTAFGLGLGCNLTGLHTLKIKETDRLVALLNELEKLGANVEITNKSIHLKPSNEIEKNRIIKTYNDHRMAMAFAPLALKVPITIEDADVVTKSYRNFWKDLSSCFD